MAKFRFTGQHTRGQTKIDNGGVVFTGHEPAEVTDAALIKRLRGHPEFVEVGNPLDHDGNGKAGGSTGAVDHMRELRAEYQAKVGKRPFSGWDEATLRAKMAAA